MLRGLRWVNAALRSPSGVCGRCLEPDTHLTTAASVGPEEIRDELKIFDATGLLSVLKLDIRRRRPVCGFGDGGAFAHNQFDKTIA